ncbi:MAG: hypothetical protein N3B21_01695 [Clostridia bacterium]|nr:hypothetical protein [Clostridia bacterium]
MKYTAEEILNAAEPWEVFTGDIEKMRSQYAAMAKRWHPDFNDNSTDSNAVMSKINSLYKQGMDMLKSGEWKQPGLIKCRDINGKVHEIRFQISHSFELGTMYIGDRVAVYLVDDIYRDLFKNADRVIREFTFANDIMKEEISRYLPKVISKFETTDNRLGMVVEKKVDLFLLRDVLSFYDGKVPVRHVAWILSTLYNLVCYLDYADLSHNAISLDTYFISPQNHNGALLGGWWYGVYQGSKMIGVPEITYSIMPPKVADKKCGDIITDLELIRLIGRELLGDRNGSKLYAMGAAPVPIIEWLRGVSSGNALEDYRKWGRVLEESFGTRRFVEMNVTGEELYSKINGKKL